MSRVSRRSLILAAAFISAQAHAGGYVEGPDLSNDRLNPTAITLDAGSNVVQGKMGYTGLVLDRDFFSITINPGFELTALVLGPATQSGGAFSFIGLTAGPTLTVDPDTITSGADLLGWHLYGTAEIGTNILPAIGFPVEKIGFTGPLPSGTYTFWVQELDPNGPYPFQYDFQVAAVPEPSTHALLGLGVGMVAFALNRPVRRRLLG